jgi:prepilin-type N-terminal cleavage/methylation domain-containing protein
MAHKARGFTLTELLVVIGIVAILAAILFPVFSSARAAALKTVCSSNYRQVNSATQMYLADYDDRFMLVNYDVNSLHNSQRDRTWVQLLMPYINEFGVFTCPSDYGNRKKGQGIFDQDLIIGDPYQRFYEASLRSNLGYNYLYFCPIYRQGNRWVVEPRSLSQVTDAASSMIFVDSVYSREGGIPYGGGSYVVVPPCRYTRRGGSPAFDSFNLMNAPVYGPNNGWVVSDPNSAFRFGLAWAWHTKRITVGRPNGGTASISASQLSAGCDVRDSWTGYINDYGKYSWDVL